MAGQRLSYYHQTFDGTPTATIFGAGLSGVTVDTSVFRTGPSSLRLDANGTTTDSYATIFTDYTADAFSNLGFTAGRFYTIRGWRRHDTAPVDSRAPLTLYLDSAGGGAQRQLVATWDNGSAPAAGTWGAFTLVFFVNSGEARASFRLYHAASSGSSWFDDLSLMEGVAGTGAWWLTNDGQGAVGPSSTPNSRLVFLDPGTGNMGIANFSTTTTQRNIQLPAVGTATATWSYGGAAVGQGFNFPVNDFTDTIGAGTRARYIKAGTTINVTLVITPSATDTNGAAALAALYIRNADATFTLVMAHPTGVSFGVIGGSQSTVNVPLTLASDVIIPAGATLHVEVGVNGRGVGVVGQTFQLRRGLNALGLDGTRISTDGTGIRFRSTQTPSVATANRTAVARTAVSKAFKVTASSVASMTRVIGINRARSQSSTAAMTRTVTVSRAATSSSVAQNLKLIILLAKVATASALAQRGALQILKALLGQQASAASMRRTVVLVPRVAASTAASQFQRQISLSRTFLATTTSSASTLFQIPQSVLNRMSTGNGKIVRKVIQIFDD